MTASADPRALYLDLMERCLLGLIYEDAGHGSEGPFQPEMRDEGKDWPSRAHTMIGTRRLHSLRRLTEDVLMRGVPGDMIETGVWRGGACILMRAVLKAYGVEDRTVWCADSFEGLPPPDATRYPQDEGDVHHTIDALRVSLEQVQANFAKYGLLDGQVKFLAGWFRDTLPGAPISRLSILRLDGDMYQSTMEAITALYDRLSPGGYVIVDDLGAVAACEKAIVDFRTARGIRAEMCAIDWTGAYWRKDDA